MVPSSTSSIVTLTTDFGVSDHYVGTMKGVIVRHAPGARVVDITHDLPPFSLLPAAYAIDQAAPFYPHGTIHVVIVDPGVGTRRKALLVETGGYQFLAPDNGVLSLIMRRYPDAVIRELTNPNLFLRPVSSTFHGRDIFASVAGHLASGNNRAAEVGPVVGELLTLTKVVPRQEAGIWSGLVLSVDRFGNLITNLPATIVLAPGFACTVGEHVLSASYPTFAEAPAAVCFLYRGSSGYLEIGVNQGSAADRLQVETGAEVSFAPH